MRTKRRSITGLACLLLTILLAGGCKTVPNSVLRQRAYIATQKGDLEVARENYQRAATQDPTDWESQYRLGETLLKLKQPVEAQLTLEKARVLRNNHPETPRIIDLLAEAFYQQNRPEQLHMLLREAADEFSTVHDYVRQGDYMFKTNEMDGARVAYLKAVRFASPGDIEPYAKLATFYEKIGDMPKAVTSLRNAHYINPNDPGIADRLREHGIVPGPAAALKPEKPEEQQ